MEQHQWCRALVRQIRSGVSTTLLLLAVMHSESQSQIIIRRDTTFTGIVDFTQAVVVADSTVTVTFDNAQVTLYQGITVEGGKLNFLRSTVYFLFGSGISVSRRGDLFISWSEFQSTLNYSAIGLVQSNGRILNSIFRYVRIFQGSGRPGTPDTARTMVVHQSNFSSGNTYPSPLISGGGNILIQNTWVTRDQDTASIYNNIEINGKYSTITGCTIVGGGVHVNNGNITDSQMDITDNEIHRARVGISGGGIRRIERNRIEKVRKGIECGTTSLRWYNGLIKENWILNVSEQAINVVGDNLVIDYNSLKGNGETGKGINFSNSSGIIRDNLITNFKIRQSSLDINGIALYVQNKISGSTRSVDITGNVFERCGLHDFARRDLIASIVYLETPVNFIGNDIGWCTLGGRYSPTHSFAGGPALDIVVPKLVGLPVIINHNMIHSNQFYATGAYEPTNTRGALVAANFDNRKLEFLGNKLFGVPDTSLGIALFPVNFPNGIVGDSLIFEENTIMDNRVGIGTMYAPSLGPHNVLKQNTQYEIKRYGAYIQPTMYAMSNNWESADSGWIDSRLYDNEEWLQNGPIVFAGYYSKSYNATISVPAGMRLDEGDSVNVTVNVTDSQGIQAANIPVFLTTSNPNAARFKLRALVTDNNGLATTQLYGADGGTTSLRAFAGDTASAPVQVYVQGSTGIDPSGREYLPKGFALEQNYPNPFNPSTTIRFSLPHTSFVELEMFNLLGQRVALLAAEEMSAGTHDVVWNAHDYSSGVYFYQLIAQPTDGKQSGTCVQTRKLMLLK